MIPFDAVALLAMLGAFYPTVSIDALAQARRDRPSYFAGGALTGAGDRLSLGDGRSFLLIWQGAWVVVGDSHDPAVAGVWDAPRIRAFFRGYGIPVPDTLVNQWLGYWALWGWKDPGFFVFRMSHAQELVDAGKADPLPPDAGGDGLTLDAGPLVPLDPSVAFLPRAGAVFEPLVSDALGGLDGTDAQLDHVQTTITTTDPAQRAAAIDTTDLDDASGAHDNASAAADVESIASIAGATDGQRDATGANRGGYDEQAPPDVHVPDPGPKPPTKGDDGDGGGPPKA